MNKLTSLKVFKKQVRFSLIFLECTIEHRHILLMGKSMIDRKKYKGSMFLMPTQCPFVIIFILFTCEL